MLSPINTRSTRAESHKTYMASAAFTIPESAGFLAGSSIYAGFVEGFDVPEAMVAFDTADFAAMLLRMYAK